MVERWKASLPFYEYEYISYTKVHIQCMRKPNLKFTIFTLFTNELCKLQQTVINITLKVENRQITWIRDICMVKCANNFYTVFGDLSLIHLIAMKSHHVIEYKSICYCIMILLAYIMRQIHDVGCVNGIIICLYISFAWLCNSFLEVLNLNQSHYKLVIG